MIERRNSFGFPNKALHTLRVSSNFCGQHLDRHSALQLGRVLRQIHLAHTALANLRADFIAADFCADGEGHFRWVILWLQSHALHKFREAWVRMKRIHVRICFDKRQVEGTLSIGPVKPFHRSIVVS